MVFLFLFSFWTQAQQTSAPSGFEEVQALLNRGNVEKAMQNLRILADQKNPDAFNLLGNLYLVRRDWGEAERCYGEALNLDASRAEFHNNLGILKLQQHQGKEALCYFFQAIKLDPDFPDAFYNLGLIFAAQGKGVEAKDYFSRTITLNPAHPLAHYRRASILMGEGALDLAIADYKQALKANPDFQEAWADLGFATLEKKDFKTALKIFQLVLLSKPDMARAQFGAGLAFKAMGDWGKAMGAFQRASELAPKAADPHLELGFAWLAWRGAAATEWCEQELLKAIAVEPQSGRAHYLTAVFYDDLNQVQKACAQYEAALALNYGQPKTEIFLAQNYLRSGQKSKAKPLLEKLLKILSPKSPYYETAKTLSQS